MVFNGMDDGATMQSFFNGWLVIDKPAGMTSYDVIRRLKRFLPKTLKIGHAGTLDPMATGVLPIALGQATRLIEYVHAHPKAYIARWIGGSRTDTEDFTGNVIEALPSDMLRQLFTNYRADDIRRAFYGMIGVYRQTPPMVSARKVGGKRLYQLSRAGMVIPRASRPVLIYTLRIMAISLDRDPPTVDFYVRTSQGTYIRTLIQDIGIKLGIPAHLGALRRTEGGGFTLRAARPLAHVLELLEDDPDAWQTLLYPLHTPLRGIPLRLPDIYVPSIQNGRLLYLKKEDVHAWSMQAFLASAHPHIPPHSLIQLIDENDHLLALYRMMGEEEKTYVLKAEKVFPTA